MAIFNTFWASFLSGVVVGTLFGQYAYQFVKHGITSLYQAIKAKI
jgi:hypothetical protein